MVKSTYDNIIEAGIKQGKIEGKIEGKMELLNEIVKNAHLSGFDINVISELVILPIKEVRKILKDLGLN